MIYDENGVILDENCLSKDIDRFISNHPNCQIDMVRNGDFISKKNLKTAEKMMGMKFGKQLTEYLTKYGYLACRYVELYGINARQGLDSDMVKQTLYLHKYFPDTVDLVAIENQGDGDYYLVDTNDEVFRYVLNNLIKVNCNLSEYILQRMEDACK